MNRLYWFGGILLCVAALFFGCTTQAKAKPWYELGWMGDEVLDQVLLFYLGEAWTGMTDVGEVLETAGRINVKDPRSWAREWRKTAERLDNAAMAAEAAGHRFSAGELSLRAASYYRATLHRHMDPYAPEVRELAGREVAAFTRAMRLLELPVERVAIPYEGTTLAAYWYHCSDPGRHPVLIAHQGRDAWAEDNFYLGREALRRGYDCLIVDGPGQGSTLRLQGLPFRPDWEKVISPAIDWLVARPDVEPRAIGLMGMSMGGALAPRAAEFEPRIAFLVANPGVSNWSATFFRTIDKISPMIHKLATSNPRALDALMTTAGKLSPFLQWGLTDTMWKHGVKTPSALMTDMQRYNASPDIGRIACPTLVIDGEAEEYGDAKTFYDALSCPKTYLLFTKSEAAPLHVQTAALALGSQRIFDWIDDTVKHMKSKELL
jgi:alpha-beta hydrolase superfamily lysophospholipase